MKDIYPSNTDVSYMKRTGKGSLERRFSGILLSWNRQTNKREMPWKGEKDPYKIWLSEIILQQTRVEQGLTYYTQFIKSFPDIHSLANAQAENVFKQAEPAMPLPVRYCLLIWQPGKQKKTDRLKRKWPYDCPMKTDLVILGITKAGQAACPGSRQKYAFRIFKKEGFPKGRPWAFLLRQHLQPLLHR